MAEKPSGLYHQRQLDAGRPKTKPLDPVITQELIDWLDYHFMGTAFTFKDDLRRMDFKHGEMNVVRAIRRLRNQQLDPNYKKG